MQPEQFRALRRTRLPRPLWVDAAVIAVTVLGVGLGVYAVWWMG